MLLGVTSLCVVLLSASAADGNWRELYEQDRLPQLDDREQLASLAHELGFSKGAELGVDRGNFARQMLRNWDSNEDYHAVDMWQYPEGTKNRESRAQQFIGRVKKKLSEFGDKVKYHRQMTNDAAQEFEDGSLDLVYIDANHEYSGVVQDMHDWWPKLRVGGIFSGHDYSYNPIFESKESCVPDEFSTTGGCKTIAVAVDEFCAMKDCDLMVTTNPHPQQAKYAGNAMYANVKLPCFYPECPYPMNGHAGGKGKMYPYNKSWYFKKTAAMDMD